MTVQPIENNNFIGTKPHYQLLDGLRGVAALLVVWYHIFEGYAFAGGGMITGVNHGYLAVDFFFMLSGFVISYAYDDRLGTSMSVKEFFRRRLIRLHPMVIMGAVIGMVFFLLQGSVQWDGTQMPGYMIFMAFLLAIFCLPVYPGAPYDIRGNGEMFPLNGPNWSLFFEYIGNIFYALIIRRFSKKVLVIWTALMGLGLWYFALTDAAGYGSIGVGWTLDSVNFVGGLLRMLFPFSLGMLLARNFKPVKVRGAFWICSAIMIALFHVPYVAGANMISFNGLYEMLCITLVFPALIWLGASGTTTDKASSGVCKFLGDISYPLYMVHYPVMYLFYSWLIENELYTLGDTWPMALLVVVGSVALAYACLKLYDIPVRRFLSGRSVEK